MVSTSNSKLLDQMMLMKPDLLNIPFGVANFYIAKSRVFAQVSIPRIVKIMPVLKIKFSRINRFIWPGFGDNSRVLEWIIRRIEGQADAVETPIGRLPVVSEMDLDGVDITEADLEELFRLDPESWKAEADLTEEYFGQFGDRVPAELRDQLQELRNRLG